MRVGVLVSGRGSNLAALLDDAAQPGAPLQLAPRRLQPPQTQAPVREANETLLPPALIPSPAPADRRGLQRLFGQ